MADHGVGTRHPKACITCAKAKVRCLPEVNGPCKRCRRLGKECGNQLPGAHRREKRLEPRDSDVAALEAKLDRMVAMLAASERNARERLETGPATTRSSPTFEEIIAAPGEIEGQLFMEVFFEKLFPLFPFVTFPSHVTAEELRREKPFLYLNISMVACQNARRQREIVDAVQGYVAEHIVIRGEYSLDLLQGLLVNVAWFTSVSRFPRPAEHENLTTKPNPEVEPMCVTRTTAQLDVFVHLLVAQSLSLGLNQGVAYQKNLNYPLTYLKEIANEESHNPVRTLEERRTYLGCYYLTSMISTCVKDLGPIIRFTRYTDECCNMLDQVAEYPTDTFLVQLVRAMNLADRVHHTLYHTEFHSSSVPSAALGLSIRWLEAELKQLKDRMRGESPHSTILQLHYNTVEIHLYRVALSKQTSQAHYGDHPLMRLDLLFRCLETTTSFFRHIFALPSGLLPYFPFTIISQLGKATVTLSQLSLYDHPGWDRAYVENAMNFDQTIDQIFAKLEEQRASFQQKLGKDSEPTELPEIFGRMSYRVRTIKQIHRQRKEVLDQTPPTSVSQMDYELMMNMPLDLLFPFGELPPIYGQS
ncbi:hypothetical protein N7457_007496 [Penicillium paradoxum]|uniref:uncharacterized protein n=1 Tax=Penicillium paradoxum TaxID=176176 RepID=UPI002547A2CD|nr:uncharacterized protein N7457_007496 [Penicillium paradoxum]KAJ5779776.1 hypothetical protein N7457_007496 [Penicillium paradoxum]